MAGFVLITLAILTRYAGAWGVPYFGFTSERGSECTNNFTGYVCTPITLAEVEFYADLDLPDDTTVTSGTYRSTHDYQLEAQLDVPPASAAVALKSLSTAFGPCVPEQPSSLNTQGLAQVCVMANLDAFTEAGEPASRLYVVGTGLRKDGSRPIALSNQIPLAPTCQRGWLLWRPPTLTLGSELGYSDGYEIRHNAGRLQPDLEVGRTKDGTHRSPPPRVLASCRPPSARPRGGVDRRSPTPRLARRPTPTPHRGNAGDLGHLGGGTAGEAVPDQNGGTSGRDRARPLPGRHPRCRAGRAA